jgi:hypothetical protein
MIEPTDRPEDYDAYDVDVEESVRKGLENRPELAAAKWEIERQQVQLKFAKNQRLPQFDLVGEYGNEGLSGDENPNLDCRFGATRRHYIDHPRHRSRSATTTGTPTATSSRKTPRIAGSAGPSSRSRSRTPPAATGFRNRSSSCGAPWCRSGASSRGSCSRCAWPRAS